MHAFSWKGSFYANWANWLYFPCFLVKMRTFSRKCMKMHAFQKIITYLGNFLVFAVAPATILLIMPYIIVSEALWCINSNGTQTEAPNFPEKRDRNTNYWVGDNHILLTTDVIISSEYSINEGRKICVHESISLWRYFHFDWYGKLIPCTFYVSFCGVIIEFVASNLFSSLPCFDLNNTKLN